MNIKKNRVLYLHEDQYTFMFICRSVLFGIKNVSDRSFRENHNTFSVQLPPPENRAICELTWKSNVKPFRTKNTILRMRIACWVPKTANTHSEYVILIEFLLLQWLHESASLFPYTYMCRLILTLRLLMSYIYIYIYIWSTYS